MQPPSQHSRINLIELKAQLIKRLGPERSKQYFHYLNKLLNLKISKVEFNKLCLRVLGRENVRLHNLLISSILKNACTAKVPPPPVTSDESQRSGDALLSPRISRSKASTRFNTKVDSASHESTITNDNVISGNRNPTSCDIWKPVQHHQEVSGKADNGRDVLLHNPQKSHLTKASVDGFPEERRETSEALVVEDGKGLCARPSLQAPFGISLFSGNISGARRVLPSVRSDGSASSYGIGGLLDSESLRERMQQIAALEGLGGLSMDCANLLNNGLDLYLQRLIRMCIELAGTRNGCNLRKNNHPLKQHLYGKLVNGVLPSHHNQVQNSSWALEGIDEQRSYKLISLLDFKVAMELNPQGLGEDWPFLLEKIYMRSFEKEQFRNL